MDLVGKSCNTNVDCINNLQYLLCVNKKCFDDNETNNQGEGEDCFKNENCSSGLYCKYTGFRSGGEGNTASCQKARTAKEGEQCFFDDQGCAEGLYCQRPDLSSGGEGKTALCQKSRTAKEGERCFFDDQGCAEGLVCGLTEYEVRPTCTTQVKRDEYMEEKFKKSDQYAKIFGYFAVFVMVFAYIIIPAFIVGRYYGPKAGGIALVIIVAFWLYQKQKLGDISGAGGAGLGLFVAFVAFPLAVLINVIGFYTVFFTK